MSASIPTQQALQDHDTTYPPPPRTSSVKGGQAYELENKWKFLQHLLKEQSAKGNGY